jgi:hypothetical protein
MSRDEDCVSSDVEWSLPRFVRAFECAYFRFVPLGGDF